MSPQISQAEAHAESLSSPTTFWHREAQHLDWEKPYSTPLRTYPGKPHQWTWFPDGKISGSYNLITRHVLAGNGDAAAIYWDSPVTGKKRRISYRQLQEDVEIFSAVMKERGVGVGDRVLIYMPMIPEALVAMLACTHIGAIHSVVFGGFAPAECAKRIDAAEPVLVLTASCGIEGGANKRKTIPYLPFIREAIQKSTFKPRFTLLYERDEFFQAVDKSRGELQWNQLVRSLRVRRGLRQNSGSESNIHRTEIDKNPEDAETIAPTNKAGTPEIGEALPADHPHYIIYTSGTTGAPKGVVRPLGGHLVGLSYAMRNLFDITRPGQTIFTASDIGWVVGHAFIVYAPLLIGASTVLYEGKPIGTPNAGTFWRIVEEYNVDSLFCAPSALRAICREDPRAEFLKKRDLRNLRGLFLAGERSEPSIVTKYQELLPQAKVVDNWWSSESGSPMTGVFLTSPQEIKPGSAGPPLPGWNLRVVDDDGNELPHGEMGNIVLAPPLAPTGFTGLFRQDERYWNSYYARFKGKWIDTGDAGVVDADGFLTIMSRTDDLLNVAAHRLSTAAIEGAACMAAGVEECYVVGVKDELKGEAPMGFVVAIGEEEDNAALRDRVNIVVRREVGPIAGLKAVVRIPAQAVPRTRSGKVLRRAFRTLTVGEVVLPEGVDEGVWKCVAGEVGKVLQLPGRAKL